MSETISTVQVAGAPQQTPPIHSEKAAHEELQEQQTTGKCQLAERGAILLLCYINFLNYVDRGIVPGAPESFQAFTTKTLGVAETDQGVYFGLLNSAFIAATALFSLVFGHLSLSHKPFKLIAYGMSVWVVAIVISGVAYYADSFYLLLAGRAISGVGEGSFQCIGMAFINRNAPEKNRTLWLGIMITSLTVGMAVGYVYGSAFATTSLGWASAFFVEAVLMLPAIALCIFGVTDRLNTVPDDTATGPIDLTENLLSANAQGRSEADAALPPQSPSPDVKTLESITDNKAPNTRSVREWLGLFKNIPYTFVVLGHTSYTFALTSFSTYTPILSIALGFYEDEAGASFMFGLIVLVAGTVGTIGGALILDHMLKGKEDSRSERRRLAVDLLCCTMTIGGAAAMVMLAFTNDSTLFHLWLGVALIFMSAMGPAESVAAMESFPASRQAMAVAANSVVLLIVGQVPSPLIVGALKDKWAPLCGTIDVNGDAQLNPACSENRTGLNHVLLFSAAWLPAAALLWGAAKYALHVRSKQLKKQLVVETP